ncbi:sulfotransferase domain-containing protein [Coleofasciculus sp. E2-BRE-01]|uniref:sulfotransferase domain-containing protein n=1 Tax=Coleofasciculus sp. E2-BRE-01 TaxID=3069524 RepID=UPI003303DDA8
MKLPYFLIIGAAKSGTTTLYQYLCRHPQVYMSTPKEPEFFARDDRYAKGIEWYASLFSQAEPHQICGEASTIYTLWPHFPETAARIARWLPHVKLIYVMRHPVDRAYSYYVQLIKNAQNTRRQLKIIKTFEESINPDVMPDVMQVVPPPVPDPKIVDSHLPKCPGLYLDGSDYIQQIEQYLQFFPREAFLFLLMEDLIQSPADSIKRVFKFLEIDDEFDVIRDNPIAANQTRTHTNWFLRSRITAPLKKIPGIYRTAKLLPQGTRDQVYHLLKRLPYYNAQVEKQYLPQPMRPETRQMLLEKFCQPNQRLAEFLNRDLSHWSK